MFIKIIFMLQDLKQKGNKIKSNKIKALKSFLCANYKFLFFSFELTGFVRIEYNLYACFCKKEKEEKQTN